MQKSIGNPKIDLARRKKWTDIPKCLARNTGYLKIEKVAFIRCVQFKPEILPWNMI
jgi:hypothetical protein